MVGVEQQICSSLGAAVGQPAGSTRHDPGAVAHVDLPQRGMAHDRLLYRTMRVEWWLLGLGYPSRASGLVRDDRGLRRWQRRLVVGWSWAAVDPAPRRSPGMA